jgi:hypothetical protein
MLLVDDKGHLVSTVSEDELHNFAECIGLKKEWYQDNNGHPRYDVTTKRKYQKAIDIGAQPVPTRKLIKYAWWAKREDQ